MRIKICGITKVEQGLAIAQMGATALGFICVPASARYVALKQLSELVAPLPKSINRIGVFAGATLGEILDAVEAGNLTGVQLHADESPEFCQQLRQMLPEIEIIKALRVRSHSDLVQAERYTDSVETLLLDAYHPHLLGGTGKTLDWLSLREFRPPFPWLLAGGLTPENILDALRQITGCDRAADASASHPQKNFTQKCGLSGIDLSSGVERSPGDKDLAKVAKLFENLSIFLASDNRSPVAREST